MAGNEAQFQTALNWGADVNHIASDHNWQTPLHVAARAGHVEIVEALLAAGADAERTDAESLNPLESAIINEQPHTARLLAARVPETIAQAYPVLARILRDAKSPVLSRQLCVEAMGSLETRATDSIPTLLSLLESESRELGQAAAEALAKIDHAAIMAQAIPYLTYILDGPLVKKDSTHPEWIANLYAARGDLYRLAGRYPLAVRDYEAALNFAAPGQRQPLQDVLMQLEPHAMKTNLQEESHGAISSPRNT
jgi:tetratricopeptide (TPR) repeat protein